MPTQTLDPELGIRQSDETVSGRDFIYCATCSSVIGRIADKIAINGSHDHVCTNPHGIRFHLGCWSEALGCTISGQRMAADTWFPGFRWRLASCAECHVHIGWYFDRDETNWFYGLILDRIQQE
jgi:hypothetical protein